MASTYFGKVCARHPELGGERREDNRNCLGCCRDSTNKWRKDNPEKARARLVAYLPGWLEKNKVKVREGARIRTQKWRIENVAKVRTKANSAELRAYRAARRAACRKATPTWANAFFIQEAYRLAKLREKVCGGKWHVDHVVPLKSALVCGLHCEANMAVIPALHNHAKGNRTWPDMP